MRRSTLVTLVIIILLIVAGAWLFASRNSSKQSTASPSPSSPTAASPSAGASPSASSPATSAPATTADTVDYTTSGFSPSTITVKSGGAVTFKNSSGATIQVDSDPHPEHTDNTELNVGQIAPGGSKTVTLTRVGSWGIHNHLDSIHRATVVVQ
jgi:plastocyanin